MNKHDKNSILLVVSTIAVVLGICFFMHNRSPDRSGEKAAVFLAEISDTIIYKMQESIHSDNYKDQFQVYKGFAFSGSFADVVKKYNIYLARDPSIWLDIAGNGFSNHIVIEAINKSSNLEIIIYSNGEFKILNKEEKTDIDPSDFQEVYPTEGNVH